MRRALTVVAGVLAVLTAAPAPWAHETDPALVTVLDSVRPALPADVRVTVAAGAAAQLVVANPTATPLEVLGASGRVFLRVSAAGVFADVASGEWRDSNRPGPSAAVHSPVAPRFVQVHPGSSWGWYDHRLHPAAVDVTAAVRARGVAARVASWSVPLRYGATPVTVHGHVQYRPVRGRIAAAVTTAVLPAGITVAAVDGRLPALFLRNETADDVRVLGPDGEVFAVIGPRGVAVDPQSRVHLEDARAKGLDVAPGSPARGLTRVSSSHSYSWLDLRLRYPDPVVPERVQRRSDPTVLLRWSVPLQIAGRGYAVAGTTSFVPHQAPAARDSGRTGARPEVIALAAAAAIAVIGPVAVRRRRTVDRSSAT